VGPEAIAQYRMDIIVVVINNGGIYRGIKYGTGKKKSKVIPSFIPPKHKKYLQNIIGGKSNFVIYTM